MTRTSAGTVFALALGVAGILLVGCTPDETPIPTPGASTSGRAALTFADGAALDPTQDATWVDVFAGDDDAEPIVAAPDGDGSWSYRLPDTQCVVGYWQGGLGAAGITDTDDAAASDELLAAQFGTTPEEIRDFTAESGAGWFSTVSAAVQTRAVAGKTDAGTYLIAARGMTVLDRGLVASLTCPAAVDVVAEWDALGERGAFGVYFVADPSSAG